MQCDRVCLNNLNHIYMQSLMTSDICCVSLSAFLYYCYCNSKYQIVIYASVNFIIIIINISSMIFVCDNCKT